MKKIGIVAFENYPNFFSGKKNRKRLHTLALIAKEAKEKNVTHILFPGSTLYYTTKQSTLLKKHLLKLQNLFKHQSIVIELRSTGKINKDPFGVYAIEKGEIINRPIPQLFSYSYSPIEKYKELYDKIFIEKKRFIKLDGIKFLILVCGEINYMKSSKEHSTIVTRHEFGKPHAIPNLHYDILFNPSHHPFQSYPLHYNKLKWKHVSKKGRYGIITLDVESEEEKPGAIFVFHNGKESLPKEQKKNWVGKKYVMETIDYKKSDR